MTVEKFGYEQTLKRSLSVKDLVIYGMLWMIPVAPFGIYGYVAEASNGMVVMAYLVGVVAVFFTAMSYKAMSADFPLAGSVYIYAQHGIGEAVGFLAGWLILLDYILIPALLYIGCADALAPMFPEIPKWAWVVVFTGFGAGTNLLGVEFTAKAGKLLLVCQLIVLVVFCGVGSYALYAKGIGSGGLTLAPLYKAGSFSLEVVFSAVSIAALSFLGFDAISTLSEEVRGEDKQAVGKATLIALFAVGSLFILQTWIAADLANGMPFSSLDTAFYEVAGKAGGDWLYQLTSWTTVVAWGIACSMVSTAAIARVLFAMARDGHLPRVLTLVSRERKSPYVATLLVAVVSLLVAIGFIDRLETITSFVNFGALTGFLVLHVAVINHFTLRHKSRQWIKHLLLPLIGMVIIGYVLYSMGRATWTLGLCWLAVGVMYYLFLTCLLKRRAHLEV